MENKYYGIVENIDKEGEVYETVTSSSPGTEKSEPRDVGNKFTR